MDQESWLSFLDIWRDDEYDAPEGRRTSSQEQSAGRRVVWWSSGAELSRGSGGPDSAPVPERNSAAVPQARLRQFRSQHCCSWFTESPSLTPSDQAHGDIRKARGGGDCAGEFCVRHHRIQRCGSGEACWRAQLSEPAHSPFPRARTQQSLCSSQAVAAELHGPPWRRHFRKSSFGPMRH